MMSVDKPPQRITSVKLSVVSELQTAMRDANISILLHMTLNKKDVLRSLFTELLSNHKENKINFFYFLLSTTDDKTGSVWRMRG